MEEVIRRDRADSAVSVPDYTNIADGYQSALKVVDDVILKNYISELSKMEIVPLSRNMIRSNIRDNVRFSRSQKWYMKKTNWQLINSPAFLMRCLLQTARSLLL